MRPPGSGALAGEKESGKKRSSCDANVTPPKKKKNKVDKDDGEAVHEKNEGVEGKGMKVEDDNEVESIKGERQEDQVVVVARGQDRSTAALAVDWVELPTALFGRVLEWLSFTQGRRFFACNSVLWREKRVEYESQILHELVLPGTPPLSFLGTLDNVESLDFGPHCTDEHLKYMRDERVLPKLKHLGMARSLQVTDEGLAFLAKNPARCRTLETLDVTFCRQPTYGGILVLRDRLKALVLMRRQPKWMDTKAVFEDGTCEIYWPDGSFASFRENDELYEYGYFRDLFELESQNLVTCKVQFVHSPLVGGNNWASAPDWMRYAYRPARAFLHCLDEDTILDASLHKGAFPIHGFPRPEHSAFIPLEHQAYFNRQGETCHAGDPNKCVKVGHGRSGPLTEWMPPLELVQKFRTHHQGMEKVMAGRNQERDEREVHLRTGGQRSDTPPPQWFQYQY